MSDSNVFYELTKTISESERVEFLNKIKSSIQFDDGQEEHSYHKELGQSERDRLIEYDIKHSGFITRFLLWLKSKFSGKRRRELFVLMKIKSLKRKISKINSGLTGFETRDLTPKLAEAFWEIYTAVLPLRGLFKKFWMRQKELETAYTALIEANLENVLSGIDDLLPNSRILELYTLSGKKDTIKNEIISELEKYISKIDNTFFENIVEGLIPFYYLKEVVLFPYVSFFNLFQFTPLDDGPVKRPSFRKASAMLAIDYMEKNVLRNLCSE